MSSPEWTPEHARAAAVEGWNVFESRGSMFGPWQIESFDDPGDGPDITDDQALQLVRRADTLHARAAIEFLRVYNPIEHASIFAGPIPVHAVWNYKTDTPEWGLEAVRAAEARIEAELARQRADRTSAFRIVV